MKFSHTIKTFAAKEDVWSVWTDVERWPEWDKELENATLEGQTFDLGVEGTLKPKRGPSSSFVISEYEPINRYAFTTRLPLSKLVVRRLLKDGDDGIEFTHEISFVGPLAFVFGRLLGRRYKAVLPEIMENVRSMAERRR